MVFQKVFGAAKEFVEGAHNLVKEGAIKSPELFQHIEQGINLAKKIPGLSLLPYGGYLEKGLDMAGNYMKKTREEVEGVENPLAKKVLSSELNTITNQQQQQPTSSVTVSAGDSALRPFPVRIGNEQPHRRKTIRKKIRK